VAGDLVSLNPFKRDDKGKGKKRFVVSLSARGQRKYVGTFEAADEGELMNILSERLNGDESATLFPKIRILDTESGQEIRVDNPFFSGEEESGAPAQSTKSGGSIATEMIVQDVLTGLQAVGQINQQIMSMPLTMMNEMMTTFIKNITSLQSSTQPPAPPGPGSVLKDGANFLAVLLEVAKPENRKNIEELMKTVSVKDLAKLMSSSSSGDKS
jgi:hypothetical protein